MKLGIVALTSLASLVLIAGCAPETPDDAAAESSAQDLVSATSAYTESSRTWSLDACTYTHEKMSPEATFQGDRYDCGEMNGYTLVAEAREESGHAAYVRTPSGTYSLQLGLQPGLDWQATHWGYFGKLAEWRGRGITSSTPAAPYSGRVEPYALIMRYFTPSSMSDGAQFTGSNSLIVAKLSPEGVCVHSVVSGATANHNQIARDIADSQAFRDFTCPVATPEPIAPTGCGVLQSNTGLEMDKAVSSCSGSHSLVMQTDGNLVLYNNRTHRATWSSRTAGSNGYVAIMRGNGQLGVFEDALVPVFQSPNAGEVGARLAVQDDGNVVIYSKENRPLWATGTQGQ